VGTVIGLGRRLRLDLHKPLDQFPVNGSAVPSVLRQFLQVFLRLVHISVSIHQKALLYQHLCILFCRFVPPIAEAHDLSEVLEIEASLDACPFPRSLSESRMKGINA
jgi:hypothetical protein